MTQENRYSRQELFQPIGITGQRKISQKHVLLIGCGALGTSIAESLVRAGIGEITIVDRDYVEISNLQRQQLFVEQDAIEQKPKAIAAKERLLMLRPDAVIHAHIKDITAVEMEKLVQQADVVMDGTDNFETRFMINDAAVKFRKPWIYGACVGSTGAMYVIRPHETPCLRCMWSSIPAMNQTCDTAGIISPAVQLVTAYQTAEALKLLVEDETSIRSKLLYFDTWTNERLELNLSKLKKPNCPSCGPTPTYPSLLVDGQMKTAVLCGRNTVQIRPNQERTVNLAELAAQIEEGGIKVKQTPYLLQFYMEDFRMVFFADGRLLIHGLKDRNRAKKLYHQLFG
ncbi:ThiF family adenylyltransferase [Bacillus tianshenii]|nr:ThiF family adenylyltransferase [Bacillus tianshenii]